MNIPKIMDIIRKEYAVDSPEGYRLLQNIFTYVNNQNCSKDKEYLILKALIGDNYGIKNKDIWNLLSEKDSVEDMLLYTE